MAGYRGKRLLDLTLALPALLLSLPVQAVVAGLVRARLGSPVFFRQMRPGRNGQPFEMVKFRTMRGVDPTRGWTEDSTRLTPLGARLRSWSLDELPTLWNIVRGDMSLVGPRPLLPQYLERYTPEQARRHEVLPGLTGLAQVSGRNLLDWDERFSRDVAYVDGMSLRMDLGILGRTFKAVVRREGINEVGGATMTEFTGSKRADG